MIGVRALARAFFLGPPREDEVSLHLCYRLTLPGQTSVDDVRAKLGALKTFAESVGFDDVLGPSEYTLDDLAELEDRDIVKIMASTLSADPPDFYGVPFEGTCAMAFVIVPGEECDPAVFGFLAPGARSDMGGEDDDLHPGEWFWSGACQTRYASRLGEAHLVRCHGGLVRVLEHASTLGITVSVEDETGYWDHRSTAQLMKVCGDVDAPLDAATKEAFRRRLERQQADGADPESCR
jgi:hypothetical protein